MKPIAVALVAIAGTLYAGVEPLSARADFVPTFTTSFQCANQGWILQAEQSPGGTNQAKLISQGNSVDGTYDGNNSFTFMNNSYQYQVKLQGSDTASLRIIDRNTGRTVDNQQCTQSQASGSASSESSSSSSESSSSVSESRTTVIRTRTVTRPVTKPAPQPSTGTVRGLW